MPLVLIDEDAEYYLDGDVHWQLAGSVQLHDSAGLSAEGHGRPVRVRQCENDLVDEAVPVLHHFVVGDADEQAPPVILSLLSHIRITILYRHVKLIWEVEALRFANQVKMSLRKRLWILLLDFSLELPIKLGDKVLWDFLSVERADRLHAENLRHALETEAVSARQLAWLDHNIHTNGTLIIMLDQIGGQILLFLPSQLTFSPLIGRFTWSPPRVELLHFLLQLGMIHQIAGGELNAGVAKPMTRQRLPVPK